MMSIIAEYNADLDIDFEGGTPLEEAVLADNTDMIQYLLEVCDASKYTYSRNPPVMHYFTGVVKVNEKHLKIIEKMLKKNKNKEPQQ